MPGMERQVGYSLHLSRGPVHSVLPCGVSELSFANLLQHCLFAGCRCILRSQQRCLIAAIKYHALLRSNDPGGVKRWKAETLRKYVERQAQIPIVLYHQYINKSAVLLLCGKIFSIHATISNWVDFIDVYFNLFTLNHINDIFNICNYYKCLSIGKYI